MSYAHEDLIDLLLANPQVTQAELARFTGYSQGWLSRVMASDAFREQMERRRNGLIQPILAASVDERFRAIGIRAADVVMDKLDCPNPSAAVALKALEISEKALRYGARPWHRRMEPVEPPVHLTVNMSQQVAAGIQPLAALPPSAPEGIPSLSASVPAAASLSPTTTAENPALGPAADNFVADLSAQDPLDALLVEAAKEKEPPR